MALIVNRKETGALLFLAMTCQFLLQEKKLCTDTYSFEHDVGKFVYPYPLQD